MRVLLAGFGPFPGARFNPTTELVQKLARARRPALAGLVRTVHVFATSYAAVDRDMAKLHADDFDIVLVFGLAARRRHICIETRARNALSVLFPDASGWRSASTSIERGGPNALFGNAPFRRLLHAGQNAKVPIRLSRDAGRYLCNYAYWRALERARDGRPLVQFIHIPLLRRHPQPMRPSKYRLLSPAQLLTAAENLLVALVAARRR